MMIVALAGFFLFSLVYAFVSAAIIYHLSRYTLPGWTMGKISIYIFLLLGAVLFILAIFFFFQVPWQELEHQRISPFMS